MLPQIWPHEYCASARHLVWVGWVGWTWEGPIYVSNRAQRNFSRSRISRPSLPKCLKTATKFQIVSRESPTLSERLQQAQRRSQGPSTSLRRNREIATRTFYPELLRRLQSVSLLQRIMLGLSHPAICVDFSLPGDEPEVEPKGDMEQLQPSANVAIAEASETKCEVSALTLLPPEGFPEPLIHSEDKSGLSSDLPGVALASPDPFSSSDQEKSLTDIQDNLSAQIGTHPIVNSSPVSSTIFSVRVAGAQGIVLIN